MALPNFTKSAQMHHTEFPVWQKWINFKCAESSETRSSNLYWFTSLVQNMKEADILVSDCLIIGGMAIFVLPTWLQPS